MYLAKALWFRACVWIQLIMVHLWDKNWIISVKIGYGLRYCFVLLRLFCCRTQRCINISFSEMWIIIISTFLLLSLWTLFSLVHSRHAPWSHHRKINFMCNVFSGKQTGRQRCIMYYPDSLQCVQVKPVLELIPVPLSNLSADSLKIPLTLLM